MTTNTPESPIGTVLLEELCKLGSPVGVGSTPPTAISSETTYTLGQIVNTCPWAGIDMGAPEESGK